MRTYSVYDAAQIFRRQYEFEGLSRPSFYEVTIYPIDEFFIYHGKMLLEFENKFYKINAAKRTMEPCELSEEEEHNIKSGMLEKYVRGIYIKSSEDVDE